MTMLFRFLYKRLLENTAFDSLKLPHLCNLNPRFFSKNVPSEIIEKKRESIFSLFKSYGFTDTQISTIISKTPSLLRASPEKMLKPKLNFLSSFGFSSPDLYQVLNSNPTILGCSLAYRLKPNFEFLQGVLEDNESVVTAVKRASWILMQDYKKKFIPNLVLLRSYGVPESRLSAILRSQPRTLMHSPERLKTIVEEVEGMGFEPEKSNFVMAVEVIARLSKSTWNRKLKFYRKWGWSDDEIRLAFRKKPHFMISSEQKVESVMDFLVNQMGWDTQKVIDCPSVFMHSLENWTIPRCLVVHFLMSKGVIDKDISLNTVIALYKKTFMQRYVDKYSSEYPEVLNLYGSGMDVP